MITDFKIFEGKQVGILYHFTSIYALYKILSQHQPHLSTPLNYISCTRNFNMKSKELRLEKQCCRITLDGDKLSQKYKIKPHFDQRYPEPEEREERIINDHNSIPLEKYVIRIDILENPPININDRGINAYTFEDKYSREPEEIKFHYEELKNKIKDLNSKFPIIFVDKMRSVKLNENVTDIGIEPPKQKVKKSGDNNYKYYAIFEELFIPKGLVKMLDSSKYNRGESLLTKIYDNNPYNVGTDEFKMLMKYTDQKIINDKKYDKLVCNDYLRTLVKLDQNKIKELHEDLIINILDKYNTENIDLNKILKFNVFSNFAAFQIDIDEDHWDVII